MFKEHKVKNMKYLIITTLFLSTMGAKTIFDFTKKSDIQSWRIVDDRVMGGRSQGEFSLNSKGHGVFEGNISLDNYGGFSSVRLSLIHI